MRNLLIVFIIIAFTICGIGWGKETNRGAICGFVYDQSNGAPIENANVIVRGTNTGTISDVKGRFSLRNLPKGKFTIEVRVMGFRPFVVPEVEVSTTVPVLLQCPLEQSIIDMPAVEVVAEKEVGSTASGKFDVGKKVVDVNTLNLTAGAMEDVGRAMLKYPSVSQRTDANAFLQVRGSSPDQNLVLLNGAKIINPYAMRLSMGGGTSIFPADIIEAGELLAGGFGSKYGNRLAAVLNVRYRDGSREGMRFRSEANLMSARVCTEGPLPGRNGSWIVSMGRTYYEYITDLLGWQGFVLPTVSNVHGRFVYDFSVNNKIALNVFWNDERTDLKRYQKEQIDLFNKTKSGMASLNHRLVVSKSLAFETTISRYKDSNTLRFFDAGNTFFGGALDLNIENYQISEEISISPVDWYFISIGAEFEQQEMNLLWGFRWRSLAEYPDGINFKSNNGYGAVFMEHTFKPSPSIEATLGVRRNYYVNPYSEPTWSPRFQLRAAPTPFLALKLAGGIFHQYPDVFSTIMRGGPVDFSKAADTLKTERADHIIAGAEIRLSQNLSINVEAYHKQFCNLLVNKNLIMLQTRNAGYGVAEGIEVGIEHRMGHKNWWGCYLGYGYGKAMYRLSGGQPWRFFDHDRRHNFSLQGQLKLHRNFRIDLSWRYGTGFPYTPIIGSVFEPWSMRSNEQGWGFLYGERNSSRYPDYHRLDMRFTYQKNLGRGRIRLYLDLANFYNRQNVFIYDWDISSNNESGIPSVTKTPIYMMPFLPSLGISLEM